MSELITEKPGSTEHIQSCPTENPTVAMLEKYQKARQQYLNSSSDTDYDEMCRCWDDLMK